MHFELCLDLENEFEVFGESVDECVGFRLDELGFQ